MRNKIEKAVATIDTEAPIEAESKREKLVLPTEEEKVVLIGNLMMLQNKDLHKQNPELYKTKSHETISEVDNFLKASGGNLVKDVNEIYRKYSGSNPLIVRRENPIQSIKIVSGEKREMTFDGEVVAGRGDKYANCALWPYGPADKTSGLANAFLEGQTSAGPIVTVLGFRNNPEHMQVEEPEGKMLEIGDISRHAAKILSGHIEKSDLEFVIVRIPVSFADGIELEPVEQQMKSEGKLKQIFRGYDFSKNKKEAK